MNRHQVDQLDPTRTYWVPALVAPSRNWSAASGCHRGSRFVVDRQTLLPSREEFSPFDTELSCLHWIMRNRADLNRNLPGATIRPVPLDRWLLGLD